jgi:WD40 repeat protein
MTNPQLSCRPRGTWFSLTIIAICLARIGLEASPVHAQAITYLEGHQAPVRAVAYSPDGKTLVSGDETGVVIVWDRTTMQKIRVIKEHASAILDLAMAPDGLRFVSVGLDRTVKLHDLPMRAPLAAATGLGNDPTAVAVSTDGAAVFTGDNGGLVRQWNGVTMATIRDYAGVASPVTALALSPSGKQLVAAQADGGVRGWLVENAQSLGAFFTPPVNSLAFDVSGNVLATGGGDGVLRLHAWPPIPPTALVSHGNQVAAVAASADGRFMASGSADQTLRLFGSDGKELRNLPSQVGIVTALAFGQGEAAMPAAKDEVPERSAALIAGGATGTLHVWRASDGQPLGLLAGHVGAVTGVAAPRDASQFASAGADGTLRIWRMPQPPQVLSGHAGPIGDLALGPQGKLLATVSGDNTVGVWDPADGKRLLAIAADQHPGGVKAVAISPDASQLATGDPAGVVRLFNATDGQPLGQIAAHAGAISRLAFHPKGRQLYSTGVDGTLKTWQLPLDAPLSFGGHTDAARAVAASRDGKLVVSGGDDKSVRFFDGPSGKQLKAIDMQPGSVTAVALSPDAALAAATDATGQITVWSTADYSEVVRLRGHEGAVQSVSWHPKLKQLATAGADGTLRIWDLPGEPTKLAGHTKAVLAVSVSPNGQLLATASADGTVRLWDAKRQFLRALQGHAGAVHALAWNADGSQIVTASADKTVRLWNTANAQEMKKFDGDTEFRAVAISRDGTRMAAAAGKLGRLWNVADGKEVKPLEGHTDVINALVYSPNLDEFVSASADGTLRTWKKADGAAGKSINHGAPVAALAISFDGQKLVSGSADKNGSVKVWNAGSGAVEATIPAGAAAVTGVAFSRDNKALVATATDGSARLFDLKGVELQRFSAGESATSVAFAPEGMTILAASGDTNVYVYAYALSRVITGHQGAVSAATFTPDGAHVLSAGADKTVRLWNLANGQQVRAYAGHGDVITSVAVSGDGTMVVAGGVDKTVRSWTLANAAAGAVFTHPAAVRAVGLSPDGTRVATAGDDNAVHVWDVASGKELQALPGHTAAALGVSFAGDSQTLVSCSADKSLRRWSLAGQRVVSAHQGKANDLALSPDGSLAATAGDDNLVKLWDAQGKLVRQFTGSTTPLLRVAISPDGTKIAAGGDPLFTAKDLFVWNVADAAVLQKITQPAAITALAFSGDGQKVAVGCGDNHLRVFQVADGRLLEDTTAAAPVTDLAFTADSRGLIAGGADNNIRVYPLSLLRLITGHQGAISSVAYANDAKQVVTAGADKTVRLWDVASGKERQFTGSTGAVFRVAVSPDGKTVAALADDRTLRTWNLADAKPLAAVTLPAVHRAIAFTGDSRRLLVGGDDNLLRVYDVALDAAAPVLIEQFPGHTAAIQSLAAAPDGRRFISGAADNTARLWTASVSAAVKAHQGPIHAVAMSPDSSLVFTAGEDKTVAAWELVGWVEGRDPPTKEDERKQRLVGLVPRPTLRPARKFEGATAAVRSLGVSGDGTLLAAAGDDQHVRVWNAADGTSLAALQTPAKLTSLALSRDGTKIIVSAADNIVRNYTLRHLKGKIELALTQESHGHTVPPWAIALSGDGQWLFSIAADRTARRWLAASGAPRWSATGHEGPIYSVAFSRNSARIATASGDKTVRLWSALDGKPLAAFTGHEGQVYAVAFSPDGARLASAGMDQAIRLWDLAGKEGKRITGGIDDNLYTLAFSPDGRYLTGGNMSGLWQTWDLAPPPPSEKMPEEKPLRTSAFPHPRSICRAAYSPNGNRLATLDASAKLILWNSGDGAMLHHQQLPATSAYNLAYSPTGQELAFATRDRRVMILAIPSGAQ